VGLLASIVLKTLDAVVEPTMIDRGVKQARLSSRVVLPISGSELWIAKRGAMLIFRFS
jgi:hypothetical protein